MTKNTRYDIGDKVKLQNPDDAEPVGEMPQPFPATQAEVVDITRPESKSPNYIIRWDDGKKEVFKASELEKVEGASPSVNIDSRTVDLRIAENNYGNEQLTVTVPDGGDIPNKVSKYLPQMSRDGSMTWKAQAGQHSDAEWYRDRFEEEEDIVVNYFSERPERSSVEAEVFER